jgi:hypothetical protein
MPYLMFIIIATFIPEFKCNFWKQRLHGKFWHHIECYALREMLLVNKQATQKFDMERFSLNSDRYPLLYLSIRRVIELTSGL